MEEIRLENRSQPGRKASCLLCQRSSGFFLPIRRSVLILVLLALSYGVPNKYDLSYTGIYLYTFMTGPYVGGYTVHQRLDNIRCSYG